MRYLPAENVMLALGGSKSVESALLVESPSQEEGSARPASMGRSVSSGLSVITAPDGLCRLRLGDPSPIALPGLREGAWFPRMLKSW